MSVSSMTGFGAARFSLGDEPYQIELRSVNHRHLDIRSRLPRELLPLEPGLRRAIAERISRGHVDFSISCFGEAEVPVDLLVDRRRATRVRDALEEVRATLGLQTPVALADVVAFEGVIRAVPRVADATEAALIVEKALNQALDELDAMRRAEGERLATDLRGRIAAIREVAAAVAARLPGLQTSYRERLRGRVQDLLGSVGEGPARDERLEIEIVLAAERADITEEMVRLQSHLAGVADILADPAVGARGRKLEFLAVELNRELNTAASKINDSAVSALLVDAKSEVERLREQVANVE